MSCRETAEEFDIDKTQGANVIANEAHLRADYEIFRSSHRRWSIEKSILGNFAKFTSVFLWILQNFWEHLFYRTPPDDCLWTFSVQNTNMLNVKNIGNANQSTLFFTPDIKNAKPREFISRAQYWKRKLWTSRQAWVILS